MFALDLSNWRTRPARRVRHERRYHSGRSRRRVLQRALHMTGARRSIATSWKVPDAATHEFVLEFYRRIGVLEEPKHAALWAAKTNLRNDKDERGNPRYGPRDWAAWVQSGEPDRGPERRFRAPEVAGQTRLDRAHDTVLARGPGPPLPCRASRATSRRPGHPFRAAADPPTSRKDSHVHGARLDPHQAIRDRPG